jgi:hypothetical protein
MKLTIYALLTCLVCLIVMPAAHAQKRHSRATASVTGVYENITVGKGSGDLEGMRVVIVPAGGGHYAIVQIAQGGAEDPKPEFVQATVKGMTVDFTVGTEKYTGTVTAAGMRVKDSGGTTTVLKRKPCASYFR